MTIRLWNCFKNNLKSMFFPEGVSCLQCEAELSAEDEGNFGFCKKCFAKLPFSNGVICEICGDKVTGNVKCVNCSKYPRFFDKLVPIFEYRGFPQKMILKAKEGGNTYFAKIFARLLFAKYKESSFVCDYITFIASSKPTIKMRGYDVNLKMAEEFSKLSNLPVMQIVSRSRFSKDSAKLNFNQRKFNAEISYDLIENSDFKFLKDKTILVIDDLATTCATIERYALLLKKAEVKQVFAMTICR